MLTSSLKSLANKIYFSRFSTLAVESIATLDDFRTNESHTSNHTEQHLGRFYTISAEEKKKLFGNGGFPKSFEKQTKTFAETTFMIRQPALEIIEYIKRTNFNNPVIRYVLYGENGVGKSITLAHMIHYGYQNDFVLIHIPWVPNWFKRPKEIANSDKEGFVDLPFDAAAWLVHFKLQNTDLLNKLNLKTSKDYVWSKRETTPAGSTLLQLVEHGINRIKFSTGTIEALISELKQQATDNKCKVMVCIDGYNAFFHSKTRVVSDTKAKMTPNKITITQPFLNITNFDWKNGVCVLVVDKIALTEDRMESHLPKYLLGMNGFEHLDPFIPIKVAKYDDKEFENCINYYLNRKWIQNVEKGFDAELKFLSGQNPYKLMNLCAPL
ncbi:28S ribosomal protein S29, mitochondrial [Condylostylus longicornis]|uniref:28S ribosomal protein S29, mitochondrial n=1 Tax=Condylostylus longicornis TaxID=2530218 RepID=UPI00244E4A0A|nr:28S ribosomal protein S29, mitochondrial [Condylostylus longicornis]